MQSIAQQLIALKAFAKDALENFDEREEPTAQELGLKHGLLVQVEGGYDPDKHGEHDFAEPGDEWLTRADWLKEDHVQSIALEEHDRRVTELLEANNVLVEQRRELSAQLAEMEDWYKEDRSLPDPADGMVAYGTVNIGGAVLSASGIADALDPNKTKYAYIGEFKFKSPSGRREYIVPWTTIKEIMKAIRKFAGMK